jgi:DNA polymerase-3 subunit alpha
MQIANRLAGFSLGEADILRRAMGKKNREEMAAQREKFLAGCALRKVPAKKGEKIFDLMAEFAGYGFNKSHSCAYALLAYQTAYLKTHYPVEFMAALLTSETGNTEKVVKYINEARGMGITVLPPDVNSSALDFTPVGESIRFGLQAIKNVGENTVKGILEARLELGRFSSIYQFCDQVDTRLLNRRVVESLIKSGAMDTLGSRRSQIFAVIDRAMDRAQRQQRERSSGQHGLFGGASAAAPPPDDPLPDLEEWPEHEMLAAEFATVGFYISGHPLSKYAAKLSELRAIDLAAVEGRRNGEEITVGGIVVAMRSMRSRKGDRWGILTLQDMTGVLEVLAFPESFARLEAVFKSNAPLVLKGRVNVEDAGTRLSVLEARRLEDVGQRPPNLMRVRLDMAAVDANIIEELKKLFAGKPGSCSIAFDLISSEGAIATLQADQRVRPDQDLVQAVRKLCGEDAVQLEARH